MPERRRAPVARPRCRLAGTTAHWVAGIIARWVAGIVRWLAVSAFACVALSVHAMSAGSHIAEAQVGPTVPIPASQVNAVTPHARGAHGTHGTQAAPEGAPAAGESPRPAHMPFYVATKGPLKIYLFGTLHVGDPADYPPNQPFRQPILNALKASATVAFELSPDDLVMSQGDVTKYGVCAHTCLPRLLPPAMWAKIVHRMRGNAAGLSAIRRSRPWLAALLVETYDSLAAGLQTEYGSEPQLENIYVGRIVGLETLDEQMSAFTGLTLAEQREMLAQDLVQTRAENVDDVRVLHLLWKAGDADAMANWQARKSERLARSPTVSARIDDRIVYQRSRRFVTRILALASADAPMFVAIGALHLGGPKGVLALLSQQGFDVQPR
jgi:uncharacterized protein